MDELIQAITALGAPSPWDHVESIATIALSLAATVSSALAVVTSKNIARKENNIALLEQRYDCYLQIGNLLALGTELRDDTKPAGQLPSKPASLRLQYNRLANYVFDQTQDFLFPRQAESSPPVEEPQDDFEYDIMKEGTAAIILEGIQETEGQELFSLTDTVYVMEHELLDPKLLFHVRSFKEKINRAAVLFPEMDRGALKSLVGSFEGYVTALANTYHAYQASGLTAPEAGLSTRKDAMPRSECLQWCFYDYLFAHLTDYRNAEEDRLLGGTYKETAFWSAAEQRVKEFRLVVSTAAHLDQVQREFAQMCQNFESNHLPTIESYISLEAEKPTSLFARRR